MKSDEKREPINLVGSINPFSSIMDAWDQMTEEDWAELIAELE